MTTPEIDPRRVEYIELADLKADPRNPKAHDENEIDASIGRFGMLDPIVQDQRTGLIISGHGRFKALTTMEERGENPPEGVKISADGRWQVPVVTGWGSRTDSEAGAALIALNRTTELGGWVDDALLELLDGLSEQEDGLAGVGFTAEDIDALAHLSYRVEEEGPRDLDALYEDVGEPTHEDTLTRVVLDLSPGLADRLNDILSGHASQEQAVTAWVEYYESKERV